MVRSPAVGAFVVACLGACDAGLVLPERPGTSGPPRIDSVSPLVLVAELGSPLVIRGTRLADVEEVRVGPFVIARDAIAASDTELVAHLTQDQWIAADQRGLEDGEPHPVQVRAPAGDVTAFDEVRAFEGRSHIEEIAPAEVSPNELLYLVGSGFDAVDAANNRVFLAEAGWQGECVDDDDSTVPVEPGRWVDETPCVRAKVFWSAPGLVIVSVPRRAPGGAVHVRYENGAFDALESEARRWTDNGRSLAGFYASPPEGASPQPDAAGYGSLASEPVRAEALPDTTQVWREIGLLKSASVTPDGAALVVEAENRICYPVDGSGGASPALRVLVDGVSVDTNAITCDAAFRRRVRVELPGGVRANRGQHAVQVVNPAFQSPVAFFTNQ